MREGLRWRHLLTLAVALIEMTLCGVGPAGAFWEHAAHELGSSRHHLRDLLPAFLVGAAAMLGAEVGEPDVRGAGLLRGGSICRYRTVDRSATLTVIVRDAPSTAERLLARGDPTRDLGDRAAMVRGAVWVVSAGWLLSLSARRRDGGATDESALVECARRAVSLLPQLAEVARA